MKSFFVTFGKGILYFIGLPFIILFLVLYGLYMLGVFFFMLFKTIILFFEGKPTGIKDVMDEKALAILRDKKSKAIQETAQQLQPVTQNTINQTINNYNLGGVPPVNQGVQPLPTTQELPPLDTTMRRAQPIDMNPDQDYDRVPLINEEDKE